MTVADPAALTIIDAGRLLRARQLSAVELTQAVLQRIEATEPAIHAYVVVFHEAALAQAARADSELMAGTDRGPLHGIPLAIKDIFDVAGVPTRCNARLREAAPPATSDAHAVAALRDAGAVLLGKTVTQEFAAGVVSAPARNPWDPTRIPGGSSGGSAAAVAAGSCLGGLGSDTGGSIRIPASVTGIVGLKPTLGRISLHGVFPLSASLDTVGPLTRTVADAALLFHALTGRRGEPLPTVDGAATNAGRPLGGVRLGTLRPYFWDRLQPGVRDAVDAALDQLQSQGADLIDVAWPEAAAARAAALAIGRAEMVAVHDADLRTRLELFGPDMRSRLELGAMISAATYLRAHRVQVAVRRSIQRLFTDHQLDAVVTPTLPATALTADHLTAAYADGGANEPVGTAYTRLTMPFNATGQPALSLPCGFDDGGLPVGLQLVGRPDQEIALCRIGAAYEAAAGWVAHLPVFPVVPLSGQAEQRKVAQ